jgi:ribose transport system permease protein
MTMPPIETASQAVAEGTREAPANHRRNDVARFLIEYPMVWVLVVLLAATTYFYPGFWDPLNLQNLLVQNVPLLMASVGMTFVIIAGGFDLSVGSVYATGAILYLSFDGHLPPALALIIAVAIGLFWGVVNGTLVNLFNINPFVATLGTSSAIIGLSTLYLGVNAKYTASDSYTFLGTYQWHGIPLSTATAIIIFVVAALLLAKSTYGRSVYAVGGNREAARLSGIRVGLISASTFAMIGALAALGGVFTASQLATAQPNFVGTITLDSIAVVIIGGTSLMGGEGAMWRTAAGLAILAVVNNLFASRALDPSLQLVFKGLIVVVAVGVDVWSRRRSVA